MGTQSDLPAVPRSSQQSPKASVILIQYNRQGRHQAYRPRKTKARITADDTKKERTQPRGIHKEELMHAWTFENTLTGSKVYSTSSTEVNTRNDVLVQASSGDSILQRLKLVAEGVVKLLWPRRIQFTTDPKPTQWSEDVQVPTPPLLTNAIALSGQTLSCIPQTFKDLKEDTAAAKNMSQKTNSSSKQKKSPSYEQCTCLATTRQINWGCSRRRYVT